MALVTSRQDIQRFVHGEHPDPFAVLGMHRVSLVDGPAIVARAFMPDAVSVKLVDQRDGSSTELSRVDDAGFFETQLKAEAPFAYSFRSQWDQGPEIDYEDPYRFPTTLGELDLHLMGEGRDLRLYEKLGAHPLTIDGVEGVRFAVWAPNATRVSVVGDFNHWDGRRHLMRQHLGVGVWEMFVPGLEVGTLYKYEIKPRSGAPFLKSDPVGFRSEVRPATGSIVAKIGDYDWGDGEWMAARKKADAESEPMLIYEVHLGSWRWTDGRPSTYRELAESLPAYVKEMGFTHVELLPVMEHPYDPSWGYQVTGYYAPTSRFGSPEDFRYLVDTLHQAGIGVLLDWVPAHFPKDAGGLRRFDGTALYEHQDPRLGEHPDWGTMIFNYGRNEVRNFLIANAMFWLDEFHIDGLRVDAVASMLYLDYSREHGEWLPNRYGGRENLEAISFFRELNSSVRENFPGALMIAEESTAWPGVTNSVEAGGLGFHFKWNMGWMNDFLRFIEHEPIYRKYHLGLLTFSLMYAFSEKFILPISHDEVVHGKRSLLDKMPGDDWQGFANQRLSLGFMWSHPGKQLLFMGTEIGQWREWTEASSLDWHLLEWPQHRGLQHWVRDLNRLTRSEPALYQRDSSHQGFEWIDFHDVENTILSFRRIADESGEDLVFLFNFTPVPREAYRIGVPEAGTYREVLNSDAEIYGGSNMGNLGEIQTQDIPSHHHQYSLSLVLPPLGMLVLKRDAPTAEDLT